LDGRGQTKKKKEAKACLKKSNGKPKEEKKTQTRDRCKMAEHKIDTKIYEAIGGELFGTEE
jgi:hypothetical protein